MNIEQQRAAFEAWASDKAEMHKMPGGEYSSRITRFAWEAYQAGRAALPSQDREDAERYRWLRNWQVSPKPFNGASRSGIVLDEAIDHARRIEGEGE